MAYQLLPFRFERFNDNQYLLTNEVWKIQCKLPPKTKRFCPLVLK